MHLLVEVLRSSKAKIVGRSTKPYELDDGTLLEKKCISVDVGDHILDFYLVTHSSINNNENHECYDLYKLETIWPKHGEYADCSFPARLHCVVINRSLFFSAEAFNPRAQSQDRFRNKIEKLNQNLEKFNYKDLEDFSLRYDMDSVFLDSYISFMQKRHYAPDLVTQSEIFD